MGATRLSFAKVIRKNMKSTVVYGGNKGRARRSEFWSFALFCFLCTAVIDVVSYLLYEYSGIDKFHLGVVSSFVSSYFLFAFVSCMTRRIHDAGKKTLSLNMSLSLACVLIPLSLCDSCQSLTSVLYVLEYAVGATSAVFFIYALILCMHDSQKGPNKFGVSEKYDESMKEGTKKESDFDKCWREYEEKTRLSKRNSDTSSMHE